MPSNTESQCYFIQLQIDGYLDGDLNEAQQGAFVSHVQDCAACSSEFRFAQSLHDAVMELPQIECNDTVLEPMHRLSHEEKHASEPEPAVSFGAQLASLLQATPLYFRFGVSAAAIAAIALTVSLRVTSPVESPEQLVANEASEQYTSEDIAVALQELNVAIDYLNELSQRTEVMIGDRFLVSPLQDSINASFQRARIREIDPLQNGPI